MSAKIHPSAVVDASAELAEDVEIGPFCIVGPECRIGPRTRLIASVHVYELTTIGADCVVHPFAALGGPPQDLSYKGEPTKLVIGDRNVIREHVSMHRGTTRGKSVTTIGDDGLFMGQSHIAHDCTVANKVILAQSCALGGHSKVEDHVFVGGLAGVHQFSRLGRHCFVGALAAVMDDVIPFGSVVGNRAHLAGLNVIGLKRRGFSREKTHEIRSAYRMLFAEEGTFQERLEDVARLFEESPEVQEMVAFARASAERSLAMPHP